jgi:hypothetical protein
VKEDAMKRMILMSIGISILVVGFSISYANDKKYNYEVEFGKTKEEKILQFNGNGKVNITGYDGNKVLLSSDEDVFKDEERDEKAKGLQKIGGGGFSVINNKEKNVIIVSRPVHKDISLDVKVPNNITLKFGTSVVKPSNGFNLAKVQILRPELEKRAKEWEKLKKDLETQTKEFEKHAEELEKRSEESEKYAKELEEKSDKIKTQTYFYSKDGQYQAIVKGGQNIIGGPFQYMYASSHGMIEGDITINDFTGTVEASTIQGSITVKNMEGIVLANTVDGDINVVFKNLNGDKELYFSTVNGDIDITFPEKTNADVMARTVEGSVYSGFDDAATYAKEMDDEESTKDSKYLFANMFQSDYITTHINKGGQDMYLNSVNGNIYIRKGK